MKKNLLLLLVLFVGIQSFAQSNKTDINYSLKRTFVAPSSGAAVGGDLVITEDQERCSGGNKASQQIYSGPALNFAALNVNNTTSNSCITLVITTNSSTQKIIIPAGSQTGLLRFSRVKSVELLMELPNAGNLPQTNGAEGTVEFWF